ncbi:MAG: hypothetical protein VKJ06_07525 [Vampirovibrionales bacterium]|nr:hypothetical protein [Vampirovibrionales bacterium]
MPSHHNTSTTAVPVSMLYQSAVRLLFLDKNPLLRLGLALIGWARAVTGAKESFRQLNARHQKLSLQLQRIEVAVEHPPGRLAHRFDKIR